MKGVLRVIVGRYAHNNGEMERKKVFNSLCDRVL